MFLGHASEDETSLNSGTPLEARHPSPSDVEEKMDDKSPLNVVPDEDGSTVDKIKIDPPVVNPTLGKNDPPHNPEGSLGKGLDLK